MISREVFSYRVRSMRDPSLGRITGYGQICASAPGNATLPKSLYCVMCGSNMAQFPKMKNGNGAELLQIR